MTEVNVLGIVEHPNLVKLIGYCADDDERGMQRLLVYEYMPNRSVQDHISSRFQAPMPWATRLKVAQDAARGLAYLHEGMEFQVHVTSIYENSGSFNEHKRSHEYENLCVMMRSCALISQLPLVDSVFETKTGELACREIYKLAAFLNLRIY